MKNALLSILAALAMLVAAIFHSNDLIVGASLMIVGLSFWRPITNRRQAASMALISLSGGLLLLLNITWWPLLSFAGGIFFILSRLNQSKDFVSVMEMLIGLSWLGLAHPTGCFLAAILMLLLSIIDLMLSCPEEFAEIFA